MKNSKSKMIIKLTAAVLLLAMAFSFSACSEIDVTEETELSTVTGEHKQETRATETSVTVTPTATPSPQAEPTVETTRPSGPNPDYVNAVYVYSVWYDAVESNPVDYDSIPTKDAFALKGVFYFSTPITAFFQARLYKDDTILMTREVKMKENVTAEADFSAGLAGFGVFEPGDYFIELLYNEETVATTSIMRVT